MILRSESSGEMSIQGTFGSIMCSIETENWNLWHIQDTNLSVGRYNSWSFKLKVLLSVIQSWCSSHYDQ